MLHVQFDDNGLMNTDAYTCCEGHKIYVVDTRWDLCIAWPNSAPTPIEVDTLAHIKCRVYEHGKWHLKCTIQHLLLGYNSEINLG